MKSFDSFLDIAKENRDKAIEQVTFNSDDFIRSGLMVLRSMKGQELTGEDVRLVLSEKGIVPHHHNAWGALIMSAVKQKILVSTNKLKTMKTPKSHARKTMVYVVQ